MWLCWQGQPVYRYRWYRGDTRAAPEEEGDDDEDMLSQDAIADQSIQTQ